MNSFTGAVDPLSSGDAFVSPVKKENLWLVPLLFFILNLIIKSFWVTKVSYDLDESWHTFFSQKPVRDVLTIAGTDPNGPFYNLLLHFWIQVFGINELSTRYLSVILSSATAPLIYLIGKKYFNPVTGIFATLLFSFSNLHFFFSHNARVYALICFLAALSFLLFFKLIKKQRYAPFIFLIVVNTLLLYTHLTTSFFIAAQGLVAMLFFSESKKGVLLVIIAQIISAALFVPWVLLTPYYQEPVHGIWLHPPNWDDMKLVLYEFCGTQNILNLFIALFILSLIIRQRNSWSNTWKLQLVLFLWFCIPLLCSIAVSHMLVPVFQTKYIMTSSLGLFMLTAYSVSLLRFDMMIKFMVVAFLLVKLFPTIGAHEFISEDWRTTVREVKKHKTDRTLVIISPAYQDVSFCYYYDKDYFSRTDSTIELLRRDKIILGSKKEIILRQPTNYDEIILLTSHEEVMNPDTLVDFLKENFHTTCDTAFADIRMYCFKEKQDALLLISDMESDAIAYQPGKIIKEEFAHSGKNVCITDAGNPYSTTFENRVRGFDAASAYIKLCGWVYYENENIDCVFITSFEKEDRKGSYVYETISITDFGPPQTWQQVCGKIKIPSGANPNDIVKFYFWNRGTGPVYIDDMEVTEIK